MEQSKSVVRPVKVAMIDLSAIEAYAVVSDERPKAGTYHELRVEDVDTDFAGRRHIRLLGNIRDVVDALRFLGHTAEACEVLRRHGLPSELFLVNGMRC